MSAFSEHDWKVFTKLHPVALERFHQRALDEVTQVLANSSRDPFERFAAIYKLIREREKELRNTLNDYRRSAAFLQVAIMYSRGLLTEEEFGRFSPETRNDIKRLQELRGA